MHSWIFVLGLVATMAQAPAHTLPTGQVIPSVAPVADPAHTYALYLPSQYRPDRAWPLLMAFHPAARGIAFVNLYRDAAEQYGYIVVASNTSRNGPWAPSLAAAQALTRDVGERFSVDPARFYMTGFSGGARVAMHLALTSGKIAGVIASGAGFPDAQTRRRVAFDIAGTVGGDDFNYGELRSLDRGLTSPHRLFVFEGGHTLPPAAIAQHALEWLELRAMIRGTRPRDDGEIERWFRSRVAAAEALLAPEDKAVALQEIVDDFRDVRDVSAEERSAGLLLAQADVKRALSDQRTRDAAETRLLTEIASLEAALKNEEARTQALLRLRGILKDIAARARSEAASPDRRMARRILGAVTVGVLDRVSDPEYLKLLNELRASR